MTTDTLIDIKLNKNIPLPKKNYVLRCIEEESKEAGTGNMMVVRQWEIVDPAQVPFNGKNLILAGTKMRQQVMFKFFNEDGTVDEKKTKWGQSTIKDDFEKLGYTGEIDYDNPTASFSAKDMLVDAVCNGKEYIQCEDLTPEQRAKGDKQGTPILDRNTGKPLKGFNANIQEVLGVSSFKPTNPY